MALESGQFKADFAAFVLSDGTVAGLLGERLYNVLAPQVSAKPFAVYRIVDRESILTHSGRMGLETWRIDIEVYSDSLAECDSVRDALNEHLDGTTGTQGSSTYRKIAAAGEDEFFDEGTEMYGRRLTYEVTASQT